MALAAKEIQVPKNHNDRNDFEIARTTANQRLIQQMYYEIHSIVLCHKPAIAKQLQNKNVDDAEQVSLLFWLYI